MITNQRIQTQRNFKMGFMLKLYVNRTINQIQKQNSETKEEVFYYILVNSKNPVTSAHLPQFHLTDIAHLSWSIYRLESLGVLSSR